MTGSKSTTVPLLILCFGVHSVPICCNVDPPLLAVCQQDFLQFKLYHQYCEKKNNFQEKSS